MSKLNQNGAIDAVILLTLFLVLAAGGIIVWRLRNSDDKPISPESTNSLTQDVNANSSGPDTSNNPEQNNTKSPAKRVMQSGTNKIIGHITYPSEGLPKGLEVCALNVDDNTEICSDKRLSGDNFAYGVGFEIQVPKGDYKILARLSGSEANSDAYYDKYIESITLRPDDVSPDPCMDKSLIEPIIIKIEDNQVVKDVVAADWYYPYGLANCSNR